VLVRNHKDDDVCQTPGAERSGQWQETGVDGMGRLAVTDVEVGMGTAQVVVERVRAHYLEMPGMRLTVPQVQRLCGVDRTACEVVLEALVEAQFLCMRPDGTYARSTDGGSHGPNRQADFARTQSPDDGWRQRKCLL
jgi:hypothetical protein